MLLIACRPGSRQELWVIPKGYVGWLRLDYSIVGQSALPIEGGRYVVRVPPSGRLLTSTQNSTLIDDIEYVVEDSTGRHKVEWFAKGMSPAYGIQNAYWFSKIQGSRSPEAQFECVFVGTAYDLKSNGRDCRAWQLGQREPPKFAKRLVVPQDQ
jgi:hypothetical protein